MKHAAETVMTKCDDPDDGIEVRQIISTFCACAEGGTVSCIMHHASGSPNRFPNVAKQSELAKRV
jgi:hypothetical protein